MGLAGVRVLFDGLPSPILYASATQINGVVPHQFAGRASVRVAVEYNNRSSTSLSVRVSDTAPGIFTTDGSQAAALNVDGSVNSFVNPAIAGTIVVLYLTGEGPTAPAGVEGAIVSGANLKKPIAPVKVRVSGQDLPASDIVYAGSAPSLVSGLMQLNLRLPSRLTPGPTQVQVYIGESVSPLGVTISVR